MPIQIFKDHLNWKKHSLWGNIFHMYFKEANISLKTRRSFFSPKKSWHIIDTIWTYDFISISVTNLPYWFLFLADKSGKVVYFKSKVEVRVRLRSIAKLFIMRIWRNPLWHPVSIMSHKLPNEALLSCSF